MTSAVIRMTLPIINNADRSYFYNYFRVHYAGDAGQKSFWLDLHSELNGEPDPVQTRDNNCEFLLLVIIYFSQVPRNMSVDIYVKDDVSRKETKVAH